MSKSEQIQTPFPDLNKYLVDCIERMANHVRSGNDDNETKELAISNMYNKTKENIQMAYQYIKQRIPAYIDIDKMPLLLSLSIAEYDYKSDIMEIFRVFSSAIHVFFYEHPYTGREFEEPFEFYTKRSYCEVRDATKDIIWFMFYACEEDSVLCGIWCGQSYIDACQSIGYDIRNFNENNFPVIRWSFCQNDLTAVELEDINLHSFIEQGAIPSGFSRVSIVDDIVKFINNQYEHSIDPFKILNLTIDKDLLDEGLSDDELDQRLLVSRENRLLAVYGENQLKLLSSSLQTYLELVQKSLNNEEEEAIKD